ncbi:MAG TPA: pyridoxamine 5'-phosphate oxidase family protein [Micromonosporaceae bacterium]
MATWSQFAAASPRLAAAIYGLVHQYGPGLGYLATVRSDGGPRVHPVSPVIVDGSLYCFVIDSPKRRDLDRDGRYALHSFPPEDRDDEAYLTGHAVPVTDPAQVRRLASQMHADPSTDWRLYEFTVDVAMVARHAGAHSLDPHRPEYHIWRDTGTGRAPRRPAGRRRVPAQACDDQLNRLQ